jgi:hypothetical protein
MAEITSMTDGLKISYLGKVTMLKVNGQMVNIYVVHGESQTWDIGKCVVL